MDLALLQTLVLVKLAGKEPDVKFAWLYQDASMATAKMNHSSAFVMILQSGQESIVTNVSYFCVSMKARPFHLYLHVQCGPQIWKTLEKTCCKGLL